MTTATETLSIIRRAGTKPHRYTDRFLGKCECCGETRSIDRSNLKSGRVNDNKAKVRCLKCKALVTVSAVRWTLTAKPHECDARCVGAKGTKCECECGGENHGAAAL
jgi:hypothetical protein